jgi:hypothetical protein
MACCGRARSNLAVSRAAQLPAPTPAAVASTVPPVPALQRPAALAKPQMLRYLGRSPITVRGPATGQPYAFPATNAVRAVDGRDAAVLMQTQYFRHA